MARHRRSRPQSGATGPVPPGYGELSGAAYLGYAHGAAGIADCLLDLWEVSGEERWLEAALGGARWLARQVLPALDDGSGLEWPMTEGGQPVGALWCHGAAGVGRLYVESRR